METDGNQPTPLHFISVDDWVGIYVGDKLEYEGHSVPTDLWLKLLAGGPYVVDNREYEGDDTIEAAGRFPGSWADVILNP